MKRYLLMMTFFILGLAFVVYAAWDGATNFPGSLDTSATLYDVSDTGTVEPEHHDAIAQACIAIETKLGSGASTPTVRDVLKGTGTGTSAWSDDRDFSKQNYTADGNITEAYILASKYHSNQGDDGEADLTLPDLAYPVTIVILIEEAQNIELNPPAGEYFDLYGNDLDPDDCVDSDSTVGSSIALTNGQDADGDWIWRLNAVRGIWNDRGASD